VTSLFESSVQTSALWRMLAGIVMLSVPKLLAGAKENLHSAQND